MVRVYVQKEEDVTPESILAIATAFVEWLEEQGWMIEPGQALKQNRAPGEIENLSWMDEAIRWINEKESEDPDPHARWSIRTTLS